jgi:hypothetical protein
VPSLGRLVYILETNRGTSVSISSVQRTYVAIQQLAAGHVGYVDATGGTVSKRSGRVRPRVHRGVLAAAHTMHMRQIMELAMVIRDPGGRSSFDACVLLSSDLSAPNIYLFLNTFFENAAMATGACACSTATLACVRACSPRATPSAGKRAPALVFMTDDDGAIRPPLFRLAFHGMSTAEATAFVEERLDDLTAFLEENNLLGVDLFASPLPFPLPITGLNELAGAHAAA